MYLLYYTLIIIIEYSYLLKKKKKSTVKHHAMSEGSSLIHLMFATFLFTASRGQVKQLTYTILGLCKSNYHVHRMTKSPVLRQCTTLSGNISRTWPAKSIPKAKKTMWKLQE